VEAAQAGDRRALDALLRRHHGRIYAVCRRIAGNDADAQDASQEALLAIVRGLPRYDGRAAFSTWAYRVATNSCLDELRRRNRRPVPVEEVRDQATHQGSIGTNDHLADRLLIDEAMASLPEDYRAAVALRDLCDLDYAQIAEALQIPAGTVRSRIARGRTALADVMSGNQPQLGERQTP
jgi:RNA polymerase sigma-70 factor (ECF subfamily)